MAYIKASKLPEPTSIDNFLGLNLNETGDTELKIGESGKMVNFRITKNYKLEKMHGYRLLYASDNKIRTMWKGKLGTKDVFIYVTGGKVYDKETELGTITDDVTNIFEFNQKLYFINGHEYKVYDGTNLSEVEGYIPLIKISTTPQGVGTDYESLNMLTGKKHQTFSPDGTETVFNIAEQDVTSIDKVIVNGEEQTTGFTLDTTNGTVTFSTAPLEAVDNIDIYWTKGTGNRDFICKNKYFQKYGLADDTRVFLYGNDSAKNRIYFSALANGVPSVEYFPGTNFIDVGSSNTAVTDINRQYDRMVISKEDESYYTYYEAITDTTGNTIISFPVYPLNSSHGMVAYNQGQVLDNYVTTIDSSIVRWISTQTKDERNAEIISQRIQEWLNDKDLSKAITLDYQELKEYWLAIDNEIMIYNYGNSTFYLLDIADKVTSLISSDGIVYMGTHKGIMWWDKNSTTYNGGKIKAEWQSGYYDFGAEYRRKTMRIIWIALKFLSKTSVSVNYITDRDTGTDEKEIENNCFSYWYWTYAQFSYNTLYNTKPFRIKIKAKKFAYLKLVLKNEKIDERLIINSIAIKKTYGGEVK